MEFHGNRETAKKVQGRDSHPKEVQKWLNKPTEAKIKNNEKAEKSKKDSSDEDDTDDSDDD